MASSTNSILGRRESEFKAASFSRVAESKRCGVKIDRGISKQLL
jgi:hypothetical protein